MRGTDRHLPAFRIRAAAMAEAFVVPAPRRLAAAGRRRLSPPTTPGVSPGDRVELRKDGPGTVVAVIEEGPPGTPQAARGWGGMGRGIVVRLDSGTLVHISEPLFELVSGSD